MKVKTLQRFFVLLAALVATIPAMAQTSLSGRVVDGANGSALAGALITNETTGDVAISSNDGSFSIRRRAGEQTLNISYLGYTELEVAVEAGQSALGDIELAQDAISVADIVVTAGIVTNDRQTPVAISNVAREQIEMRLSNQEFPEILKSTPSVYATKTSGGYGDSQIRMRGFNNNNIGVLINGVPVNDMESGRVYWSNWAGLSDVTSFMQVQRGLGASKLGISSVGGTINIVTKSTDAKRGGSVYYGLGNDGLQKLNFSVSTGLLENGWAFTIAGGRQVGDGYIRGTNYEAWNYFANLSKVIGDGRHRLSLTAFGAPQWHNQRYNRHLIEDYATNPDGRRMNLNYGYIGGKIQSTNYNIYHKPQISLVHTWEIDSKSMLSTSVYASIARGGGRTAMGSSMGSIRVGNDGRPTADSKRTADGLIDWNAVYEANKNNVNGSSVGFAMMNNSHDWYGILSSYNNQITPEIKITAGFDGRYYKGYHQEEVENLLGGNYIIDNRLTVRPANTQLQPGDLNYDEIGWVSRAGVFAQAEYLKNNFSAFLSGSISGHFIRWANYGNEPEPGYNMLSEWLGFMPWSVKGGASYKLGRHHSVFANGGYFTIAPMRANAFPNYATVPNPDANMEKVTTAEVGYTFANNVLNVTVNGYYTLWLDRSQNPVTEQVEDGAGVSKNITYNVMGVNARHMGVELEATYRPTTRLTVKAMGSVGDWIWRDDVHYSAYDGQTLIGEFDAYIGGVHVGDSAQITAALGATWEALPGLRIGADYNWYGKNFASFYPDTRTKPTDKVDAWQLPDYGTIDVLLSYKFRLSDKLSATFYGNVNNLLDTWYISDANDHGTSHDAKGALVWYGYGRTWTAGLKFNF